MTTQQSIAVAFWAALLLCSITAYELIFKNNILAYPWFGGFAGVALLCLYFYKKESMTT